MLGPPSEASQTVEAPAIELVVVSITTTVVITLFRWMCGSGTVEVPGQALELGRQGTEQQKIVGLAPADPPSMSRAPRLRQQPPCLLRMDGHWRAQAFS